MMMLTNTETLTVVYLFIFSTVCNNCQIILQQHDYHPVVSYTSEHHLRLTTGSRKRGKMFPHHDPFRGMDEAFNSMMFGYLHPGAVPQTNARPQVR